MITPGLDFNMTLHLDHAKMHPTQLEVVIQISVLQAYLRSPRPPHPLRDTRGNFFRKPIMTEDLRIVVSTQIVSQSSL
jgi:hypothetical protein